VVPEVSEPTREAIDAAVSTTNASTVTADVVGQGASDTQPFLSEVSETIINNTPAALQYGDLAAMGLAGWSPAGIIRWSFELIHVAAGLPWFWTIVAGSVFWRAVSVPFAIKGLQATARLQPHQAQMKALQQLIQDAQATKNRIEMQKATIAMRTFYAKNNINPLAAMIPLIQMPITLGLFFGVKKLCVLEQLQISGLSLLPDLTIPDPTYVLPAIMLAAIHTQIHVSKASLFFHILLKLLFAARGQGYKYHRATRHGSLDERNPCYFNSFNTIHGELPSREL
jgi:YidC/Oxa1 family membrane protein insertase